MNLIELGWVMVARMQSRWERGPGRAGWRWTGQSTVEYALVGALVVIAAAGALSLLGGEITSVFSRMSTSLAGAAPSGR